MNTMRQIITAAVLVLLCAACATEPTESDVQAVAKNSGTQAETRQEVAKRGWVDMRPEAIAARKAGK